MGGKGSGGARRGSGPKPKSLVEKAVTGNPGHRGTVLAHPSSVQLPPAPVPVVIEEFDAPNTLTMAERQVWMEYAQQAFDKRTLTASTKSAFIVMCQTILMERSVAAGRDAGTNLHRGWIQEVRKQLSTFDLWPNGKPIFDAEPAVAAPANPLDRFMQRA